MFPNQSLDALLDDLGGDVFLLHRGSADGRHTPTSRSAGAQHPTPSTIRAFYDLLERVGPDARAAWDKANQRVFDAGYGTGTRHGGTVPVLGSNTVARVGALGATVVVTIYAYGHKAVVRDTPADLVRLWPAYQPTPLVDLPALATRAGVARVWVKDESRRYLGSFKALRPASRWRCGMYAGIRALARAGKQIVGGYSDKREPSTARATSEDGLAACGSTAIRLGGRRTTSRALSAWRA